MHGPQHGRNNMTSPLTTPARWWMDESVKYHSPSVPTLVPAFDLVLLRPGYEEITGWTYVPTV
jgi:hypothetical protein